MLIPLQVGIDGADALFSLFSAISWQGYSPAQPRIAQSAPENSALVRLSPLLAIVSHVQTEEKIGEAACRRSPLQNRIPQFFSQSLLQNSY